MRQNQGRIAKGIQSSYDHPAAERSVCSVHADTDEPSFLRSVWPDQAGLVLRTATPRGAEELHKDNAHSIRGFRCLLGVVEKA